MIIVIPPGFMRRAEFVSLVYGWGNGRVHAAMGELARPFRYARPFSAMSLDALACHRALRCDPRASGVRVEDHDHPGWVANYLVVNPEVFVAWVLEMRRLRAEELLCVSR